MTPCDPEIALVIHHVGEGHSPLSMTLSSVQHNSPCNLTPHHITIFSQDEIKKIADNEINAAKIMISVFDMVKIIVEKGVYSGYQNFLIFAQCFQMPHIFKVAKSYHSIKQHKS